MWTRLLLAIVACASITLSAADRMPLGTNLSGMDDWSTEFTFVDAFRNSRPWFSGTTTTWQDQRTLDLDERGWVRSLAPGQVARTLMFWDLSRAPGGYPAGRYVIAYQGRGTLAYAPSARLVQRSPGRDVVDVDPARGGGLGLFVTATDPSDYIRNIRVVLEGAESSSELFNPVFLDRMRNYRAIRFMNWMLGQNNNNIMQTHWSERPSPQDARWSPRGVPVEVMVELANRVHADPWFTIPHLADDDYVRNFAAVVAARLAPDLRVYVEHSNEVWNGGYPQARYAQQQGLALGLSTNPREAQTRYHALRSTQIFAIFERVIPPPRLVRVLGSFVGSTAVTTTALTFRDTARHVDAVAIAPYFGIMPNDLARVRSMTPDQLMRDLEANGIPSVMNQVRQHVSIARQYGLPVIAYEGGQSLGTSGGGSLQGDGTLEALFDAVNRDPRFGPLYSRYLQSWSDAGGGLFMHYTNCFGYGRFGRFGSLEYIGQRRDEAPKFDALHRWIEGR